jgi:hypothetical protein
MRWAMVACAGLAAASLLWHAAPSYDPWSWIIWGREVARLELSTVEGPSWKPLPVLVTSLLALGGDDAVPAGWLWVARTGALLGVVMAYRLARRFAGRAAGLVAAAGLLLSFGYLRYARHGASEGLLVALVLWALERHLDGRRDHAFALGVPAALLRPETWPFLAFYGAWAWRAREPGGRALVAGSALLVPLLWLGPELVGSGDPLRASNRAREPLAHSVAFADSPTLAVLEYAAAMLVPSLAVAGAVGLATALARPRRDAALLVLAGAAAGWVGLVAAMAEGGYAGNPRYLVPVSAAWAVLAGVGVGRVSLAAGALVRRAGARGALARAAPGVAFAAAVALAVPAALPRLAELPDHLVLARAEVAQLRALPVAIARAGGREAVAACGDPYTGLYKVPAVAWALDVPVGAVEFEPAAPGVIFRTSGLGPPDPRVPRTLPPFQPVARAGEWDVLAACGEGERAVAPRARGERAG